MKIFLSYNSITVVMLILCISIIALFMIKKKFRKYLISAIVIVYGCGTGIYFLGYRSDAIANNTSIISVFIRSLFSAAAMFSFNTSFSDISSNMKSNNLYLICFWATHIFAAFFTVISLLCLLDNKIKNFRKLTYAKFVKKYIVLGVNEYSIAFIENLEKNRRKHRFVTIVIDDGAPERLREAVEQLNVAILQGNIDDPSIIRKAGLKKSVFNKDIYILALGNDEIKNIDSIAMMKELIVASDNRQGKFLGRIKHSLKDRVHFIINSTNSEWINYIDREEIMDLKTFCKADIIARQFIELCPSYSMIQVDTDKAGTISDYIILIIGFGETGQQILLKMLSLSQYETSKFKAIIIDGNMTNLKGDFQRKYSELINNYDIQFEHANIGSDIFNQILQDSIANINCVAICLQQDQKNLELAFDIKRLTKKCNIQNSSIQIAVKCNCKSIFGQKIKEEKVNGDNIIFFGEIEEVFTDEIIINEKLDDLAKEINEYYNVNNPKYATPWNKLSSFLKDANRHPAMHIKTKLNLVGLEICNIGEVPEGARVIDTKEKFIKYLGKERLEALARIEHLRWNAFYFASGWNVLPLEEAKEPKDKERKLHTCLVSWEELDKVSEKFKDDYKRKDIEQVENIVEYLKRIDCVIVVSK